MKFYNSIGPNPQVVRIFAKEKNIDLPMQEIDLMAGENRRAPYNTDVNPAGQLPALEMDNGAVITEVTAICEYLEELHPDPNLIGSTPEERAETRMWVRRIDLNILEPMGQGFRYAEGLKLFENRVHCIPQAADDLKATARENLEWLDAQMDGKTYICGNRFSLADIPLFCWLSFMPNVGQELDPKNKNLVAWQKKMAARSSASA